jgi:uncharacterized protein with HEPN domain
MPRSERLYLSDIVEAANAIHDCVAGLSFEDFVWEAATRNAPDLARLIGMVLDKDTAD